MAAAKSEVWELFSQ